MVNDFVNCVKIFIWKIHQFRHLLTLSIKFITQLCIKNRISSTCHLISFCILANKSNFHFFFLKAFHAFLTVLLFLFKYDFLRNMTRLCQILYFQIHFVANSHLSEMMIVVEDDCYLKWLLSKFLFPTLKSSPNNSSPPSTHNSPESNKTKEPWKLRNINQNSTAA